MARIVIGMTLGAALAATVACGSGSTASLTPTSPSASAQTLAAAPVTAQVFAAHTFDSSHGAPAGTPDGTHGTSDDNHGHGHEAQLEGTIVSIDAAAASFVVGTTTVQTSADTIFRQGRTALTLADLMVGMRVHVKGAAGQGAIDARLIFVQDETTADIGRAEAEGVVSGLAGTCPAVTFTVGTTAVTTTADTAFSHDGCALVVNGARAEVTGTAQADGSILASRVSVESESGDGGSSD